MNRVLNGLLLSSLAALLACGGGGEPASTAAGATPIAAPEPAPAPPLLEPEPTGPGRLEAATLLNRVAVADIAQAVASAPAAGERLPQVAPVYDVANHRLS